MYFFFGRKNISELVFFLLFILQVIFFFVRFATASINYFIIKNLKFKLNELDLFLNAKNDVRAAIPANFRP